MFLLLLLYFIQSSSQAAPLSLVPKETSTFESNSLLPPCTCPYQRSVWDILWSCFATIFACSWVSVHPNIPVAGGKPWKITLRRVKYMAWTILAPELVIYWAMKQYFGARKIAKRYQARGWTTTHGHFLQMGGFLLFEAGRPKGVLAEHRRDYTGTLADLLKRNRITFPDITKEDIEDRSKSDGLAKCLVIGQTGWFVLQCIARRATGLLLTELELVTLALASLNAFMYFFWWEKPFDLRTQVPVYLLDPASNVESESKVNPEDQINDLGAFDINSESEAAQELDSQRPNIDLRFNLAEELDHDSRSNVDSQPEVVQNLDDDGERPDVDSQSEVVQELEDPTEATKTPSGIHQIRFSGKLFVAFFNLAMVTINSLVGITEWANQYVMAEGEMQCLAAVIGIVFGTIHCAGWNFIFPTSSDLIVWRTCSAIITVIPSIVSIEEIAYIGFLKFRTPTMRSIGMVVGVICAIAFIPARFALLVEAFLTLRHLPEGAYTALEWTTYLPHI